LLQDRPTDITLAYDAAKSQGDAFLKSFDSGLDLIDVEIAAAVRHLIAENNS
jgi:hypothetical protein